MSTRQELWFEVAGDTPRLAAEWFGLARTAASGGDIAPVVVSDGGERIELMEDFVRRLVRAGVEYGEVIEPLEDPRAELTEDDFDEAFSPYRARVGDLFRLGSDSLPPLIAALTHGCSNSSASVNARTRSTAVSTSSP